MDPRHSSHLPVGKDQFLMRQVLRWSLIQCVFKANFLAFKALYITMGADLGESAKGMSGWGEKNMCGYPVVSIPRQG